MKKMTMLALGFALLVNWASYANAEEAVDPPASDTEKAQETPPADAKESVAPPKKEEKAESSQATPATPPKTEVKAKKPQPPAKTPAIGSKKEGVSGRGLPPAFSGSE